VLLGRFVPRRYTTNDSSRGGVDAEVCDQDSSTVRLMRSCRILRGGGAKELHTGVMQSSWRYVRLSQDINFCPPITISEAGSVVVGGYLL
jgi:hypothetical protein